MPEPSPDKPAGTPPADSDPPPIPLSVPLGAVRTDRSPEKVVAALDAAARRGRLAGFAPGKGSGELCKVAAFGSPFDGEMSARAESSGAETLLRFKVHLKPLMPAVFALVLVASIWPGVVLTESMIASMFPGSSFWKWTWWWYIPLTLPFSPWIFWTAVKKARQSAHDSGHRMIAKIASEVGGRVEA